MFKEIKKDQFQEYLQTMDLNDLDWFERRYKKQMSDDQYEVFCTVLSEKEEEAEREVQEALYDPAFEAEMEYRNHVTS